MSLPIVFLFYFLSSAALVYFSIKCADYVDLLDKKTSMSGAFIGGVILAAVTSLPELITSISALSIGNEGLIIGNVLGSNIFNLCIFGSLTALSVRAFAKCKMGRAHLATLLCTIIADVLMIATLLLDPKYTRIPGIEINAASLVILIIYFVSLRYLSADETENDEEDTSPLTVKQIVIRMILMALGLVVMSFVVTCFADKIQKGIPGIGSSLTGALFLGITTSLPELTSSITLVRRRNFNAMVGNVVGSNMFNFTIFSVADFFAGKTIIYQQSDASMMMIYFGITSTVLVSASILLQNKLKQSAPEKKSKLFIYALLGLGVCASYITSLALGAV
ncbi:MAG: sodium:calcium antiporter [Ruminococcaceae bacterium]|nr:sodium:calcium antiporter [Oscillospiraceae bacterium]